MRARARLVGLVACLTVLTGCPGASDRPVAPPTVAGTEVQRPPSPPAADPGAKVRTTVTVRLTGIEGARGDRIAGVLYAGKYMRGGAELGGFSLRMGADPYSGAVVVNEPLRRLRGDWPHVGDEPVLVGPGWYNLVLWRAPSMQGPSGWGRWVPGGELGTHRICPVMFEVVPGRLATVEVTAAPDQDSYDPVKQCTTAAASSEELGVVTVRLVALGHAPGDRVAGVLFQGREPSRALRHDRAVGGFGVDTGPGPLTVTRTINQGSHYRFGDPFPFVGDVPVELSPGWYILLVWRGPTLRPYTTWFPAREPGLAVCQVPVRVVAGSPTTVEVTELPPQPRSMTLEHLPRCEVP